MDKNVLCSKSNYLIKRWSSSFAAYLKSPDQGCCISLHLSHCIYWLHQTHLSAAVGDTSLQGTSGDVIWMTSSMPLDIFPPRYFSTPTPFSWGVSRSASTRRRLLRLPRNRLSTRCASAPAARSTSLLQRVAPPARPWATSASGADLGAASAIGDTF